MIIKNMFSILSIVLRNWLLLNVFTPNMSQSACQEQMCGAKVLEDSRI